MDFNTFFKNLKPSFFAGPSSSPQVEESEGARVIIKSSLDSKGRVIVHNSVNTTTVPSEPERDVHMIDDSDLERELPTDEDDDSDSLSDAGTVIHTNMGSTTRKPHFIWMTKTPLAVKQRAYRRFERQLLVDRLVEEDMYAAIAESVRAEQLAAEEDLDIAMAGLDLDDCSECGRSDVRRSDGTAIEEIIAYGRALGEPGKGKNKEVPLTYQEGFFAWKAAWEADATEDGLAHARMLEARGLRYRRVRFCTIPDDWRVVSKDSDEEWEDTSTVEYWEKHPHAGFGGDGLEESEEEVEEEDEMELGGSVSAVEQSTADTAITDLIDRRITSARFSSTVSWASD